MKRIHVKIGNVLWIFFLCIAIFVTAGAVWIRKTYGVLLRAMTNEYFRNWLQNKRRLFAGYVVLPALIAGIILLIVHLVYKQLNRRRMAYISAVLMILSLLGAGVVLDAGSYLARVHRLAQEQWYDKDDMIMHALGGIDGTIYTNSREALENSYQNGKYMMECDMELTADGEIAACHDWGFWNKKANKDGPEGADYVPTLAVFKERPFRGKFTPLSGDDLVLIMKDFPELYIITDTKYVEPEEVQQEFEALVDTAVRNNCEEVLDRFVIQIYREYMYGIVNEIYPFSNWIFTLYQEGFRGEEEKMEAYAEFCMDHDIDVITMHMDYYHDELLEIANRYGLRIFVHTVNGKDAIESYLEKGVGVYTDNLSPR